MYVRRKVFSVMNIDGEQRLFSVNEVEQREFAKGRPGSPRGRKGVMQDRNNTTPSGKTNRTTLVDSGNSGAKTVPQSTAAAAEKKIKENIEKTVKNEAKEGLVEKAGKFFKTKTGKAVAVGTALTAVGGIALAKRKKNKREAQRKDAAQLGK